MPRPPRDGVRDDRACLECGRTFTIWRTSKNCNATIRFCYDCTREHANDAEPRGLGSVSRRKALGRG